MRVDVDAPMRQAEAMACRQFRFREVVPGPTGFALEHEARAVDHAQFLKRVYYEPK